MIRKYSLLAEISQYMRGWSSLLFIDKANQVLRFIDYQCIGVAKCVSVLTPSPSGSLSLRAWTHFSTLCLSVVEEF